MRWNFCINSVGKEGKTKGEKVRKNKDLLLFDFSSGNTCNMLPISGRQVPKSSSTAVLTVEASGSNVFGRPCDGRKFRK